MEKKELSNIKKILFITFLIFIFYILNASSYLKIMSEYNVEGFEFCLQSHLLDFILYFLITVFLFMLTNNIMISSWIMTFFYFILTLASSIKANYSLSPIYLSDISFLDGGVSDIVSLVNIKAIFYFFKETFKGYFLSLLLLGIFTYLIYFINLRFHKKIRIISLFTSFLSIIILLIPSIFNLFINYTDNKFETSNLYSKHGLIAGIYGYELSTNINEPKNYDEETVLNIINNYDSKFIGKDWGTPNVIIVLSEAFVDFRNLEEIKFNEDIYSDFDYVKNNSKSFNCISPTYGGRTGNIEFEFNTMTSLRYLSDAVIPYNMLYGKDNMENYPSIAKIFNENGYETNIYSPYDNGDIYKVKYVYEKLGYKNRYFYSDILNKSNKDILIADRLISDNELINIIKENLNESNNSTFSFIKTVQNHMPYDINRYDKENLDTKIIALNNNSNIYSTEELEYFSVYGQGIYENGKALKNLYDYVQSIQTPTIVVFFGDHLPLLSDSKGKDLLQKSSYLKSGNKVNDLYNQYTTEGLIFSNYHINTEDLPSNISFDTLSAYLLKHINIDKVDMTNYIDYLYDSMNYLPACNKHISISNLGKVETLNIKDKSKEFFDNLSFIEYYYLKNNYKK